MVRLPKPQHSTHGAGVEAQAEARQEKEACQGSLSKLQGEFQDPGMGGGETTTKAKEQERKSALTEGAL